MVAKQNTFPTLHDAEKYLEDGKHYFDKESLFKAKKILEDLIANNRRNYLYYYHLAEVYEALGIIYDQKDEKGKCINIIEEAILQLKRSVELNDRYSDSHRLLGSLYGLLISHKGLDAGIKYGFLAMSECKRALELDPNNPRAYVTWGVNRLHTPKAFGGGTQEAIKNFKEAVRLSPDFEDAHIWLGKAYVANKDYYATKEIFEKVLSINPDNYWARKEMVTVDLLLKEKIGKQKRKKMKTALRPIGLPGKRIEVKNLYKKYRNLIAVNNISFDIEKGETFGLLGPNGAGKTTTIEMMEGLRELDGGSVSIFGLNPFKRRDLNQLKEIIGVQLQSTRLGGKMRVQEMVTLFSHFYKRGYQPQEVLTKVGLMEKRKSYVEEISHGQKQRLAIALALVNDPEIFFLDEPTIGLDPQARRNVWEIIEKTKEQGKTIILTTNYMEEAERLCDRVAIIDYGKIIVLNTPENLMASVDIDKKIEFSVRTEIDGSFLEKIDNIRDVVKRHNQYEGVTKFILSVKGETYKVIEQLVGLAKSKNLEIEHLRIIRPTLEDVFIKLTGRRLRE